MERVDVPGHVRLLRSLEMPTVRPTIDWSPQADRILVQFETGDVVEIPADTDGAPIWLDFGDAAGSVIAPAWSPTGQSIAFISESDDGGTRSVQHARHEKRGNLRPWSTRSRGDLSSTSPGYPTACPCCLPKAAGREVRSRVSTSGGSTRTASIARWSPARERLLPWPESRISARHQMGEAWRTRCSSQERVGPPSTVCGYEVSSLAWGFEFRCRQSLRSKISGGRTRGWSSRSSPPGRPRAGRRPRHSFRSSEMDRWPRFGPRRRQSATPTGATPDCKSSLNLNVRQRDRLVHGFRLTNLFGVEDIHGGADANSGSFFLIGARSVVRLDCGRRRTLTWTRLHTRRRHLAAQDADERYDSCRQVERAHRPRSRARHRY